MGAEQFDHEATGTTAKEAFDKAVAEACYDHGHSGYTGTIAEKNSFVLIDVPEGMSDEDRRALAEQLLSDDDDRVLDKWGPAGCIPLHNNEYLFFGWASS